MSNLPEVSKYETVQIEQALQISPALAQYLKQSEPAQFEENIRFRRNQFWMQSALATIQGISAKIVCDFWSKQSCSLISEAFNVCFNSQHVALFALGKLGSNELNLSSDIDILIVCDNDYSDWQSGLRKFQKILADRNSYGFVFRVDFDLRPGGRNGPMIPTVEQLKDYYGNYGETWERLAFVRLQYICGSIPIKNEVLSFAKKFTYRKHLDFTLLEDLKNLRKKIHAHYWDRANEQEIDLKLGIGGIRDIELFVHALQVVHGGKDSDLQVSSTSQALEIIRDKKILPNTDTDFLAKHYWNLRLLENYVQALRDEQTHILNREQKYPDFISEILINLNSDLIRCDLLVSSLIGKTPEPNNAENITSAWSEKMSECWNEILQQEVLSRNKERDEAARIQFLNSFKSEITKQDGNLEVGLLLLKDFLKSIRAKATFFAMLNREHKLLKEIAWLFGHTPYLSRILCNRPELLDSFVYRSQAIYSEEWDLLLDQLIERKLLSEVFHGSEFLKNQNLLPALSHLTDTADEIVCTLLSKLRKDYPSDVKILALGKWGGQEIGFQSDLDFIFVTAKAETSDNDFKLVKRLISRLTDAQKGGSLYAIDMRLRPSGKAGPLIINEHDLEKYLLEEANIWERQAYLKARWIGSTGFDVRQSCVQKNLSAEDIHQLEKIRTELAQKATGCDLKYSPGGLIDIEFTSQIFCLQQKLKPKNGSTLSFLELTPEPHKSTLTQNYIKLRHIEQMLQLVTFESRTLVDENHESFPFLAMSLHSDSKSLISEINSIFSVNLQILNELDPRRQSN